MKNKHRINSPQDNVEHIILSINARIERLKTQFNLFFAGELRVPPESEREDIEKMVRDLQVSIHKSPRNNLLIQNVASKFSLYNNMWKKRLNELESGVSILQRKKTAYMEEPKEKKKKPKKTPEELLDISLNREESFDTFYDKYARLLKKDPGNGAQKEKVINSLKTKLITKNLIDAKIALSVSDGKLKLKIKK